MGKRCEETFHWRWYVNGSWVQKRCSALLVIREMKTKVTVRCVCISARMALSRKTDVPRVDEGVEETCSPVAVGMCQSLWKHADSFLKVKHAHGWQFMMWLMAMCGPSPMSVGQYNVAMVMDISSVVRLQKPWLPFSSQTPPWPLWLHLVKQAAIGARKCGPRPSSSQGTDCPHSHLVRTWLFS